MATLFVLVIGKYGFAEEYKTVIVPEKERVKSGEKISINVKYEFPDGRSVNAWRIWAYENEVPPEFSAATGNQVTIRKNKRWNTINAAGIIYLKKERQSAKEHRYEINTGNWPEDDYNLKLHTLFRVEGKPEVKTDKYMTTEFQITIIK